MRVFAAMLLDGYRELNSKRLFWITLSLSALVVVMYGSIGFDDTGMSILFGTWSVESEFLTAGSRIADILYRSIFSSFIVGIWLAWIATILALISTTTIFPDFVSGGAIDLVLSKPIRRLSLFLMKYLSSLLFVLLQVGLFCVGIFLCIGLRTGDWEWKVFAAIPIVTLFYSYLYSINVAVGIWTRSALTALLVTMLFWFSMFSVNLTEGLLNQFRTRMVLQVEEADESIGRFEASLADLENENAALNAAARVRIEARIETLTDERTEAQDALDRLDRWHGPTRATQAILPKTSETIALLDRWLVRSDDVNLMDIMSGNVEPDGKGGFRPRSSDQEREVMVRMEEEVRARSLWYVVGTSLLFEAAVLAFAAFVFVRRDY